MYGDKLDAKIHSLAENELEFDDYFFQMNGVQNSENEPAIAEIVSEPVKDQVGNVDRRKRKKTVYDNRKPRDRWYQNHTVPEGYVSVIDEFNESKNKLSAFEALWAMEKVVLRKVRNSSGVQVRSGKQNFPKYCVDSEDFIR